MFAVLRQHHKEDGMAKRRFIVIQEFCAWRLGERHTPERRQFPMREGPQRPLFADVAQPGDFVTFDMDAIEYEVDRLTFTRSTRPATRDEIPPRLTDLLRGYC